MVEVKNRVGKTFDDWSSWYDDRFGRWMRYITNMVLNEFEIPDNPTCLDVACGTGISTFELMNHCKQKGRFIGIDISNNMIENARKIASEKGFSNVEFLYGDAENIDFPDDYFDLVLCNSSLHFFPDKLKALREMCRVLKPGGQWAFTYAGKPSWQEIMKIVHMVEARHPELKSLHTAIHDTEDWALEYEESMGLLEKAGLKISNVYERRGVDYTNPDIIVSESCSAWKYWKQETPEQMVDTIKNELLNRAKDATSSKGFKVTSITIFAWGTKP